MWIVPCILVFKSGQELKVCTWFETKKKDQNSKGSIYLQVKLKEPILWKNSNRPHNVNVLH